MEKSNYLDGGSAQQKSKTNVATSNGKGEWQLETAVLYRMIDEIDWSRYETAY